MSEIEKLAARMLVVGFPGPAPAEQTLALVRRGISGCILFKHNIESPEQVASTSAQLKRATGRPFLMCVDQEGGRVARLRGEPFTALPPMRKLGELGDASLVREVGRLLAREVRAVGFDWDFAPVVDVDTNPLNPVIADRSFGRDPEQVGRLGVELARGLEEEGVASSAKHFPGHGDTSQDSHKTLPHLPHGLERLRQVELLPFKRYAEAKLASVMTAHVVFEALDPGIPATLSRKVLTGLLREELGFEGVIVSDDLEMKAIADGYAIEDVVVQGANAGVDLFLVCHHAEAQERAIEGLVHGVERGALSRERLEEAVARVEILARRFAKAPPDPAAVHSTLKSLAHQASTRRIAQAVAALPAGIDPTERRA